MNMKKHLGMAMMMAAVMSGQNGNGGFATIDPIPPDERTKKLAEAKIRQNKANGLIEFDYGRGHSVWALNQKNADKKAKKLGWI